MALESRHKPNIPVHVNVPENTSLYVHVVPDDPKSSRWQASRKIVQKVMFGSPKKEPWIPPPAKTTKKKEPLQTKNIQVNIDTKEVNILKECDETSPSDDINKTSDDDDKGNTHDSPVSDLNKVKILDAEVGSGDKQKVDDNYQQMASLIKNFELMEQHSHSLQSLVQFLLCKIPKMLFVDGEHLKDLVSSADRLTKECTASFDFVKRHLNNSNSKDKSVLPKVPIFLICDMESTLSKLLENYECIGLILQLVLENQDKMGISALCSEQESLRKTMETMQNNFLAREARIQDLESQLAMSKAKVDTLTKGKKTLEDTRTHLLKDLANKESQLEALNTQVKRLLGNVSGHGENDRLIEVMEEVQKKSEAQRETLKKSIRFQKIRAEKSEEKVSQLQAKLQEKDELVYNLAAERDEWKVKMTVATNKLTENESNICGLKRQNERLQLQLNELDASHKEELSKLNGTIDEKAALLEQLSKQNNDLKDSLNSMKNRCTETEAELHNFQKIYNDVVRAIYPQCNEAFNENESKLPIKAEILVDATHEVKEQLTTLQKMNDHLQNGKRNAMDGRPDFDSEVGLLSLIQEMKQEIQILKQTFHQINAEKEKGEQIALLKEQVNTLREKYTLAAEENYKLITQVERLEKRVPNVNLFEERNNANKVQTALKENTYDANQLYNKCLQNNEEFQKQIKELRDQILRQDRLSNLKMSKLEEELLARKLEINTLESRNREEELQRTRRIKQLQDNLDEARISNESLQKHVGFLKSSYFNVFGEL